MERVFIGILVIGVLAGCSSSRTGPVAVRPTLAAIEDLGLRCGDGVMDNVPSGLFEWSCAGAVDGARSTVLVDGNDDGVAGITLVSESTDPETARRGFAQLVGTVPPLSTAPVLADALTGWAGPQQVWTLGGVRVFALCDATQCSVSVVSDEDPLRPLPLP